MVGLMTQAIEPEQEMPQEAPQEAMEQEPQQQGQQATPEQQQQFELYVRNGMRLIHSEGARDEIDKLISSDTPAYGAAMALATVLKQLNESMQEQGIQIDSKAKMAGVQELMGQIIELSQAATGAEYNGKMAQNMAAIVSEEGALT